MRRRTFMHAVGVGAAVTAVPLTALPATAARARADARGAEPVPRETSFLVGAIAAGSALGEGWRVQGVELLDVGVLDIRLERGADTCRVLGYRRQAGATGGIATTQYLDLRLVNGADGGERTLEGEGLAVMRLASRIRASERAAARRALRADERSTLRGLRTYARLYEERGEALGWGPAGAAPELR